MNYSADDVSAENAISLGVGQHFDETISVLIGDSSRIGKERKFANLHKHELKNCNACCNVFTLYFTPASFNSSSVLPTQATSGCCIETKRYGLVCYSLREGKSDGTV